MTVGAFDAIPGGRGDVAIDEGAVVVGRAGLRDRTGRVDQPELLARLRAHQVDLLDAARDLEVGAGLGLRRSRRLRSGGRRFRGRLG